MGLEQWLKTCRLGGIFADWSDETVPLHPFHSSRHLPAVKVRAFIDFAHALATKRDKQEPIAS